MSDFSNLTFVDIAQGASDAGSSFVFSNYTEAMSFAKWRSQYISSTYAIDAVYIWNINGGSGFWVGGIFTATPNNNWP